MITMASEPPSTARARIGMRHRTTALAFSSVSNRDCVSSIVVTPPSQTGSDTVTSGTPVAREVVRNVGDRSPAGGRQLMPEVVGDRVGVRVLAHVAANALGKPPRRRRFDHPDDRLALRVAIGSNAWFACSIDRRAARSRALPTRIELHRYSRELRPSAATASTPVQRIVICSPSMRRSLRQQRSSHSAS